MENSNQRQEVSQYARSFLKYLLLAIPGVLTVIYLISIGIFMYFDLPLYSMLSFYNGGVVGGAFVLGLLLFPTTLSLFVQLGVTRKNVFYGMLKGWIVNILVIAIFGLLIHLLISLVLNSLFNISIPLTIYFEEIIPMGENMGQAELSTLYGKSFLASLNRYLIVFAQMSLRGLEFFALGSLVGISFYHSIKYGLLSILIAILINIPVNTFWGGNGHLFVPTLENISTTFLAWIVGVVTIIIIIAVTLSMVRYLSRDITIRTQQL